MRWDLRFGRWCLRVLLLLALEPWLAEYLGRGVGFRELRALWQLTDGIAP